MTFTPAHHPSDDTLLRHAAGTLPPGRALVVATHLPFCPRCRSAVCLGESMGGALLDAMPHADLPADMLTRTLSRLETPAAAAASRTPVVQLNGVELPEALNALTKPRWRWLAPGISRIVVSLPPHDAAGVKEQAWLLRVAPGTSLPDHGHHGWEATCVLSGGFTDISGEYGPGDVAEMNETEIHQPIAGAGEPCICLIAWEGKLHMRSRLARLVQPLIGV